MHDANSNSPLHALASRGRVSKFLHFATRFADLEHGSPHADDCSLGFGWVGSRQDVEAAEAGSEGGDCSGCREEMWIAEGGVSGEGERGGGEVCAFGGGGWGSAGLGLLFAERELLMSTTSRSRTGLDNGVGGSRSLSTDPVKSLARAREQRHGYSSAKDRRKATAVTQ